MLKALMLEYPHLDTLMAETLIKAYENGTLPTEEDEETTTHAAPAHIRPAPPEVLQNITVSDTPPPNKNVS